LDPGAWRKRAFTSVLDIAAVDHELHAEIVVWTAGLHSQFGDAGDRSQRFTAKAEGSDCDKIGGVAYFGGRMPPDRKQRILWTDPAAIVDYREQSHPAAFDFDRDGMSAGIE